MTAQFILYRMFDHQDRLLYVGRTISPQERVMHHATNKSWFDDVFTISFERLPTHDELVEAEREAIHGERPLLNLRSERPIQSSAVALDAGTTDEARRREAEMTRGQRNGFRGVRRAGAFGGKDEERIALYVALARSADVAEDDIAWAREHPYRNRCRGRQEMIARRLAADASPD